MQRSVVATDPDEATREDHLEVISSRAPSPKTLGPPSISVTTAVSGDHAERTHRCLVARDEGPHYGARRDESREQRRRLSPQRDPRVRTECLAASGHKGRDAELLMPAQRRQRASNDHHSRRHRSAHAEPVNRRVETRITLDHAVHWRAQGAHLSRWQPWNTGPVLGPNNILPTRSALGSAVGHRAIRWRP